MEKKKGKEKEEKKEKKKKKRGESLRVCDAINHSRYNNHRVAFSFSSLALNNGNGVRGASTRKDVDSENYLNEAG